MFAVGCAAAQNVDTVYVLPEVTIESARLPLSPHHTGGRMTAIQVADITDSGTHYLDELLAAQAAIFIRQYGSVGIGGISLRGTGPSQTSILVDGHPFVSPQLGQIDLSLVPAFMLSGVNVIHGGGGALFGSAAIGGVVNLSTYGASAPDGAAVTSTVGPWGERAAGSRFSSRAGNVRVSVAVELQHVDGDFPYTNATRFPAAVERRQNADRKTRNLMAGLSYRGDTFSSRIAGWYMSGERGLPGIVGSGTSDERQWDTLQRVWLRHETFDARGGILILAAYQRSKLRYRNATLDIDDEGVASTVSAELSRRHVLGDVAEIQGGLAGARHSSAHPSLVEGSHQNDFALFLTGSLVSGPVRWFPSVRSDWIFRDQRDEHAMSGSLRSRTGLGRWYVKAGAERSFRAPTQNDLFWRGAGAVGNGDLKPERGTSVDAGAEFVTTSVAVEMTLFYQSVRDQITWLLNSEGVWSPQNVGRVRNVGVEASITGITHVVGRTRLETRAKYTYTQSRDVSETGSPSLSRNVRYVPSHVGVASVTANRGVVSFGMSLQAVGKRFVTSDGEEWLDPYAVATARLGWRLHMSPLVLDTTFFVDNLLDADFQVMSGYPMPPRHLRVRLTLTFL